MILECVRSEIDARSRVPHPPSALLKVFRTAERKNRRALHVNRGDVASNAPVAVKKHALPPRERHERAGPAWVFEPIQTRGDGARTWSDTIHHFCIGSNILIDHYAQQYARERRGWMSRIAPSRRAAFSAAPPRSRRSCRSGTAPRCPRAPFPTSFASDAPRPASQPRDPWPV